MQRQFDAYERVLAIDYFGSAERMRTAQLLAEADHQVRELLFPTTPNSGASTHDETPRTVQKSYHQRLWVTHRPAQIDRLATAWLIRRFIDVAGEVRFIDKYAQAGDDTVSFGFDGAAFSNSGERLTFDELRATFGLQRDHGLTRLGRAIHAIVTADKSVAEAAGIESMISGASDRAVSDDSLLRECSSMFDRLYERYRELAHR